MARFSVMRQTMGSWRVPFAGVAVMLAVAGRPAAAQANLSSQGFGFPTGELSSHAYATGGAVAEFDPFSPVNDASLAQVASRILFFQIEPEWRTVNGPAGSENTRLARYPNVMGALPLGRNWMIGVSASTLLDRTSSSSFNSVQAISPTEAESTTTTYNINGAMDDVRLALGWAPYSWLRLGVGGHAITGRNLVDVTENFADSTQFSTFTQTRALGFRGSAVSAGAQILTSDFQFAISGRAGGTLNLSTADTTLGEARVPNHFGASVAYTGFANSAFAVRTARDDWSSLGSLGTPGLRVVDAWDTSVGADVAGPRVGSSILFLRAGYRTRTLPFQANGNTVKENSITGGLGTSFAAGHIITDLAVIHAQRSAGLPDTEHSWTVSIGLAVRP